MDYTQPEQEGGEDYPGAGQPETAPQAPGTAQPTGQLPYQYQGGYQPPPPPKKGFNWLACCGISCVVLLVVGGLVTYCSIRFFQPLIALGMEMGTLYASVEQTDLATIQGSAEPVGASELGVNPSAYEGKWLELTAQIASNNPFGGASMQSGAVNTDESTNYLLEQGIILMDITNAPPAGGSGDRVVAYGQVFVWDIMELEKMPLVGKAIVEGMKQEPAMQGREEVVFFIAKDVALAPEGNAIDAGGGMEGNNAAGASDSGWE